MKKINHAAVCHCERVKRAWQSISGLERWIAASCLRTPRNDDKHRAFTLAEVLITITIIGVIAAITIPNLMQSYRKHQVEVGVKEAYSILNNTLKMAQAEGDGGISDMVETAFNLNEDSYDAYTYFTEKYMLPYLKYTKTCKPNISASVCGIFPYTNLKTLTGVSGTGGNTATYTRYRVLLQNGMYMSVGIGNQDSRNLITFHFDINGGKGPDKIGHDIFFFSISGNGCQYDNTYYCPQRDFIMGSWYNTSKYSYDKEGKCTLNDNAACALVLQKNGWKIPDDYPVKKW